MRRLTARRAFRPRTFSRHAATATKRLPAATDSWSNDEPVTPSVLPPAPNLSKWALPPSRPSQSLPPKPDLGSWSTSQGQPRASSVVPPSPNLTKWSPPPQPARPASSRLPPESQTNGLPSFPRINPISSWSQNARPPELRTSRSNDRAQPLAGDASTSARDLGSRPLPPHLNVNPANPARFASRPVPPHQGPRVAKPQESRYEHVAPYRQQVADKPGPAPREREDSKLLDSGRSTVAEGNFRKGKMKAQFKERGSLASARQAFIPNHPRHHTKENHHANASKEHVRKPKPLKTVNPDVYIPSVISVGNLARLLGVKLEKCLTKMGRVGMADFASHDHVLTSDYSSLLALEFGRNPIVDDEAAFDIYADPPPKEGEQLLTRPPIVTIMGHVDHGKTTLLDSLRATAVAKGEAGGITQHIGAFSVNVPSMSGSTSGPDSITFLDTPGHAAFSAMRARGARVTDVVVLVVAADDGVMPQTKEVIDLIKQEGDNIGVVVALNKIDKPDADPELVQQMLLAEDLQLETFGGDIPCVPVSGLTGRGLDDLVNTISVVAEMQDLRADRDGRAHGFVLESKIHKGLGPVATVLITRGKLSAGSHIIAGTSTARVRQMSDSAGTITKVGYPGMAVTVAGWKELPNAGDEVLEGKEADIKKAVTNRVRQTQLEATMKDLDAINDQRRLERQRKEEEAATEADARNGVTGEAMRVVEAVEGPKVLRLIVKGDVSGSVEAVVGALEGVGGKAAVTKIISHGVGDVTDSDVMMAKTTQSMIIAFSVRVPRSVETLAVQNEVKIYSTDIIYRAMEETRQRLIALLPPIIEKRVTGEGLVSQVFDIHLKRKQVQKVAGCRVTNGLIEVNKPVRVVRNRETLFEGTLDSLKHLKNEITEVRKGNECGLSIAGFDGFEPGDIIQVIQNIESPGIL